MNLRAFPHAFLLSLLLLAGGAWAQQPPPQQPSPLQLPPANAPQILFKAALVDLDGKPATLARFRGKPLIVNFWARWCGPCHTEIPDIVAEYAHAQSAGVQVVGVALDDKPDAVRDFAQAYAVNYPVLLLKDKGTDLLQQLGNTEAGLPYTLVIDRSGKIVRGKLGALSRTEFVAAVDSVSK